MTDSLRNRLLLCGAILLGLSACDNMHSEPDPTACNDFWVMTFYDNGPGDIKDFWGSAETRGVCVVAERKVARP